MGQRSARRGPAMTEVNRNRGNPRLGRLLSGARTALRMSQAEVGRRADLDRSTISRLERGIVPPEQKTVESVLRVVGPGLEKIGKWDDVQAVLEKLAIHPR